MSSTCRVAPFGYLRIKTCLQFPEAFRSLPRPSSPPEAKASTVRSCNLLSVVLIESQELFVLFYTCSHLLVALKLQSTTITIDSLSFYSLQTNLISSFNFTSLSFLKLVNELTRFTVRRPLYVKKTFLLYKASALQLTAKLVSITAPKRRCSSHTFRYGYLVTT